MKSYRRVMLGKKSEYAAACFEGGFVGADFGIQQDLTDSLSENWREFNERFVPIYLAGHPDKTRVGAGLACGALWTVSKGIQRGDIVLSPDGEGRYRVGEITGDYRYESGQFLPHRRPTRWYDRFLDRSEISLALRNSLGTPGTIRDVSRHADEIEKLIASSVPPWIGGTDPTIEERATFALEKHLEDFLVQNWAHTELGKEYAIYEEDGEPVGQQYPTDTGAIDVLAISKDKKRLLVVELKKGRASDAVVGQVLRYMGFVQETLAEKGQAVVGAIIALEDDPRIRRALAMTPAIQFYRYQVQFKLVKAGVGASRDSGSGSPWGAPGG